jgi:negative regulator of flagellin synthesis FlgM
MTQKIDGIEGRPVSVTGGSSVARPRNVGQEHQAAGKSQTQARSNIEITHAARQLATLEKVIAQIPVVDAARVKTISSAMADGRYKVDNQRVADKLLRSEADLAEARGKDR